MKSVAARSVALVALIPLMLSACDWVDSTGRQSDAPLLQSDQITLDNTPLGGANEVAENSIVRVVVARAGSRAPSFDYRFETPAIDSGALDSCLVFDRFDADRAASSLDQACSDDVECGIEVQRVDSAPDGELAFDLVIPALRASVGVRYRLLTGQRVANEAGDEEFVADDERDVDLCLVSVNDPPTAIDDGYAVLAGDTLDVGVDEGLLQNDSDDDDVSNEPLRVLNEQVQPPAGAARFELLADGSFLFESDDSDSRADRSITFEYTITDGQERAAGQGGQSSATVRLRIVAANEAPSQIANLPTISARVGQMLEFDFADYFQDPEGAPLAYSFDSPLPNDGNLVLSDAGLLAGFPGAGDAGEYLLTLIVDDGGFGTLVRIAFVIEPAIVDLAPTFVAGSVSDRSVLLGDRITPVSPQFQDPEGGVLSYASVGTPLPIGLVLDPDDGSVSGRPRLRGLTQGIVIEASDAGGRTARTNAFSVRVR